jgi:hypothetical protein
MFRKSQHKDYTLEVTDYGLRVLNSVGETRLKPAEGTRLVDLLGTVSRMRNMPKFPPHVRDSEFTILFEENGINVLSRGFGFPVPWKDLDDYIEAVQQCVKVGELTTALQGRGGTVISHVVPDRLADNVSS